MFNVFRLEGDRGARRDASSPEALRAVCRLDPGKLMGHIITVLLALHPGRRQIKRQRVVPRLSSVQPGSAALICKSDGRRGVLRQACTSPPTSVSPRAVHKGGGE